MSPNDYDFLNSGDISHLGFTESKISPKSEEKEFKLVPRGTGPLREKYRPQRINEIVPTCSKDQLKSIIRHPHASQVYLLEGRTGTGKTSCARILAKAYVCLSDVDENKPCLSCDNCKDFEKSFDVTTLNAANQNKVEDVRSLVEQFRYSPAVFRNRIFIMDEVQRLTDGSQQILLTELEEPPPYLLVFMCTTDSKELDKPLADRATRIVFSDLKANHAKSIIDQVLICEGAKAAPHEIVETLYQQSQGSIRALLNNIQNYLAGGFDPENWEGDEAPADVVSLFKAITKGNWPDLARLLKQNTIRAESEKLRIQLESYFRGTLLKCNSLDEAIKLGEAMLRLSGSSFAEAANFQYNQFVLKCLRACYVFRSN